MAERKISNTGHYTNTHAAPQRLNHDDRLTLRRQLTDGTYGAEERRFATTH
ncbi:MAG: hypothetical protein R3221_10025 [Spongiibacter sp.]|uniref:Uncharacterized protein n=1 Tax=Spongiibacter thalassae TaxID=2721624 RepID=A0ABX1GBK3_9GAMM|nr:hypothetical protein [Spongiibacter thalassae]MDX1506044.1 hypothetical protein [Spongiibacter sp.]NKI16350.1 hypothetical protein [Spongiibacter thalassae]